jgi:hypothetical protein
MVGGMKMEIEYENAEASNVPQQQIKQQPKKT